MFNAEIHHRRSIRLRNYDYSSAGAYFVTICTFERKCLFGEIANGDVRLNRAGLCVGTIWNSLPERFPDVEVDAFVVMPNHIHGVIVINEKTQGMEDDVGAIHELPLRDDNTMRKSHRLARRTMTLPKVVGYLKMNSAKRINQWRDNPGVPVWQRNYYERIIRDDRELDGIRRYIADNPVRWEEDENHPRRINPPS
ncbi:transposase [Geothermobacter hydrogeniphilus]|uniref:Transposase n=1 Tax=Geothermobacter hydrogeniphilus TaxID=1969733 RepID=A0A2K2H6Z7_9BACT|nr:transposase [Geothermobacter hydrogeniphilus]PNU19082.1 transposase [Geothermobacter hydrogeniphilus]